MEVRLVKSVACLQEDGPELNIVKAHLHPWITAAQVVSGALFYAAQGQLYTAHLPQTGTPEKGAAGEEARVIQGAMLDALLDTVLLVNKLVTTAWHNMLGCLSKDEVRVWIRGWDEGAVFNS
jgi:hypothetical protein